MMPLEQGMALVWRASWQGGILLGMVWLMTRCWRRLAPDAQVWLWRVALLKLLLALLITGAVTLKIPLPRRHSVLPAPIMTAMPATHRVPDAPSPEPVASTSTTPAPAATAATRISWPTVLVALWGLGVLLGAAGLARAWLRARAVLTASEPVDDPVLLGMLAELSADAGVPWPPALRSSAVAGPLLLRALQPTIVLPTALLQAEAPALRMILAHEVAHVRRHDLRWCWLTALVERLFFFHPLVYLATREALLAQEMAADVLALRLTAATAHDYGAMLVDTAAATAQAQQPAMAAIGVSECFRQLQRRLGRLADTPPRRQVLARVMLALLLLTWVPWRVLAEEAPVPPAEGPVRAFANFAVAPYLEMVFPLRRTYPVPTLMERQRLLYQALGGPKAVYNAPYRIAAREDAVTIWRDRSEDPKEVARATQAMTQIFGAGNFTAPSATQAIHKVDAALLKQVSQQLTQRCTDAGYGIHTTLVQAARSPSHGMMTGRITFLLTTPLLDDTQPLRKLIAPGRLEFWLLPKGASADKDAPPFTSMTINGKEVSVQLTLTRAFLVLQSGDVTMGDPVPQDPHTGRPAIPFTVNGATNRARFGRITQEHIGWPMAIAVDGQMLSAPTIQSRISGDGIITGEKDLAQAQALVQRLRTGALAAPVDLLGWGKTRLYDGQDDASH
jgi:beta-lactamase regulating signal transducer with metallopeptidase domain